MSVHPLLAAVSTSSLTPGRLWSLVAGALGVAGVVVGVLSLTRSGRGAAAAAVVAGAVAVVLGGLVVAAAGGGPGTGYGIVGGYVAVVVGLAAAAVGALGLARSRRTPVR
ncbi:DUF6223 family protein [Pseudonocardia broussonetiae]|uniref:Uncharacterized protein n=1 Tax=Pseudonocardia broussonetiae TaxID=2736640 RepID=A0A6M6JIX9_9PSEU|nr:DUF6223 family protein [Pseudonocardia broussonetiae]QJY46399.1 hypothetical protein HOP40_11790 [Pseudonocardia broussonetiae]